MQILMQSQMPVYRILLILIALAISSTGVTGKVSVRAASSTVELPDTLQVPQSFILHLMRAGESEQRLIRALRQFEEFDIDGDGINASDIERNRLSQAAQTRSANARRFLNYDFDANGVVSRKEMTDGIMRNSQRSIRHLGDSASARLRIEQNVRRQMEPFLKADTDENNELTISEIYRAIESDPKLQRRLDGSDLMWGLAGTIMKLDFDGDGTVSEEEFAAVVSSLTPETVKTNVTSNGARIVEPGCEFPEVNQNDKLVLLGASQGTAYSNVTILGQGIVTMAANLIVEDGSEPLYLVITSDAGIVWNVTGATDRVRQVVLSSNAGADEQIAGSGLVGLERSKVTFVPGKRCVDYFHKVGGIKEASSAAVTRAITSRKPDYVLGGYLVGSAVVPSGSVGEQARGHKMPKINPEFRHLTRFLPINLAEFDLSRVVSQVPAEEYKVLPMEAGLFQLLQEGKIELIPGGYRIKEKIHLPAGLGGAHSKKFLLAPGVPTPEGISNYSCIISEQSGRLIAGRSPMCQ